MRFLLLFLIPAVMCAQQFVHGKVIDASTNLPLDGANVFVSQTSFATITDSEGRFSIEVPDNNYDLLVSFLGYATIRLGRADFPQRSTRYTLGLQPNVQRLKEVQVLTAKQRENYMRIFLEYLLGTSRNAQNSRLLNPDEVYFELDAKNHVLHASAENPLLITIPDLNYKLTFILEDFAADFGNRVSYYKGYPSYAELDQKQTLSKKIRNNRNRAYAGSNLHFIRSVFNGDLAAQGFSVRPFSKQPNPEYPGDSLAADMRRRAFEAKDFSSLNKIPPRELINFGERNWYTPDLVVRNEDRLFLKIPHYLIVTYMSEKPEAKSPDPHSSGQSSQIRANGPDIEIYANGTTANPQDLVFYGYMGWEKLADTVPYDYEP